jgi:hypothetical protein
MKPLRLYIDVPRTPEFLEIPAESLTALNYQLMRVAADNGAEFPLLYDSGIVYRREPPGREWWESALELVALGEGDCEDLAAYRAAELRYREGDPARVRIYRTRRQTFHAIVERGDGTFEDPSRVLAQLEYDRAGTFPHVR